MGDEEMIEAISEAIDAFFAEMGMEDFETEDLALVILRSIRKAAA